MGDGRCVVWRRARAGGAAAPGAALPCRSSSSMRASTSPAGPSTDSSSGIACSCFLAARGMAESCREPWCLGDCCKSQAGRTADPGLRCMLGPQRAPQATRPVVPPPSRPSPAALDRLRSPVGWLDWSPSQEGAPDQLGPNNPCSPSRRPRCAASATDSPSPLPIGALTAHGGVHGGGSPPSKPLGRTNWHD